MKKLFFVLAAGMLTFAACSEFDDSELKGRIDGLEERVGDIETELSELQKSVASLNSGFASLTALLNGGLVTNVKPTDEGLEIEITYADGTVKTYTVYNGVDGEDGVDGENGTNGTNGKDAVAPKLTYVLDEATGRYQWYLDGKAVEVDGKPVYATGEQGATGESGLTPTFLLTAVGADGAPDFAEEADGDVHWFVSYNKATLTPAEYADAEWHDLGKFEGDVSVTTGMLTVDWDGHTLTFEQGGAVIGSYDIVKAFAVTFNMEDEFDQDIVEYGNVRFYAGETKTIDLEIEGGSANAVVKVELQNPTDEFTVEVKGDKIYVTANVLGAENRLFVDVLDGKDCYHSYVALTTDIPTVGLASVGGGLLDTTEGTIAFVVDMDIEMEFDVTFDSKSTVTFSGENSFKYSSENTVYNFTTTEPSEDAVAYKGDISFKMVGNDYVKFTNFENGVGVYHAVVGKNAAKATITSAYTKWTHGTGEDNNGTEIKKTYDGVDTSADNNSFWESYWSASAFIPTDPTFGIYIDYTISEPAQAVYVRHFSRNTGVCPLECCYGQPEVAGGDATVIGSWVVTNPGVLDWKQSDIYPIDNATIVRFGVTVGKQGDLTNGLTPGSYNNGTSTGVPCVGLREVEIYTLK